MAPPTLGAKIPPRTLVFWTVLGECSAPTKPTRGDPVGVVLTGLDATLGDFPLRL
ncbi:hypothetical protein D5b_00369 [Faustovirus]|nr:hypothetical protein D5b_00369 [Faustovirus]AMN84545.1 hypothetical protein D6_00138 [Faustovirus]